MNNQKKTVLKICIIGNSGVGKTSLIIRYIKNKFDNQYRITVGADLFSKEVKYNGKTYVLQIWDTAGQEKFQSIGSAFYRGSDACVLVFDLTTKKSFEALENWKKEFINQGGVKNEESFPFIVLGNKCDMKDLIDVDTNDADAFCEGNGKMGFFETSAKNDLGIQKAFEQIIKFSAEQHEEEDVYIPPTIMVKPGKKKDNQDSCSC